jgi:hypothetical protein
MIQIVHCKECGGSSIPLDGVSVNVVLSCASWCQHCRETNEHKQSFFFCSQVCFRAYMTKVLNGEATLTWQ